MAKKGIDWSLFEETKHSRCRHQRSHHEHKRQALGKRRLAGKIAGATEKEAWIHRTAEQKVIEEQEVSVSFSSDKHMNEPAEKSPSYYEFRCLSGKVTQAEHNVLTGFGLRNGAHEQVNGRSSWITFLLPLVTRPPLETQSAVKPQSFKLKQATVS